MANVFFYVIVALFVWGAFFAISRAKRVWREVSELPVPVLKPGEVMIGGTNVGVMPSDWKSLDVFAPLQEVGFLHRARVNWTSKPGAMVLATLLVMVGVSFFSAFLIAMYSAVSMEKSPAGNMEMLLSAPVLTTKHGLMFSTEEPVRFKLTGVKWQSNMRLTNADMANGVVMKGELLNDNYIRPELDALNRQNRFTLTVPQVSEQEFLNSWANPATGKPDLPLMYHADENTIFVFTAVIHNNSLKPFIGVFRRTPGSLRYIGKEEWNWVFGTKGVWNYANINLNGATYLVDGYDSLVPEDIPLAWAKAFPATVVRKEQ